MADTDALAVYLNDHKSAASAAVDLAERVIANNAGTPLAAHLEAAVSEIRADSDTLATVMERLGVTPSRPKQVAGKVLESLSRFRLNERVTGSADVTRLMELETLCLGVEGKAELWRSLQQVEPSRPELAAFDLGTLVLRAEEQRRGLEPYRLEAAATALSPPARSD
jgi:hypothetical protein